MLEEVPMLIDDDELYLIINDEKQCNDDRIITEVDYTEYVPGGRWMYSQFRTNNILKLKFLHLLFYFAEIFSLIANYTEGLSLLYLLSTFLGVLILIIMNHNSAEYLNYFVRKVGYSYLLLYTALMIYYWTYRLQLIELKIFMAFITIVYRNHLNEIESSNIGLLLGITIRSSILVIASCCEVFIILQEKYLDGGLYIALGFSLVMLCVYKDISMGFASIYVFHEYLKSDLKNIIIQAEISVLCEIALMLLIMFSS